MKERRPTEGVPNIHVRAVLQQQLRRAPIIVLRPQHVRERSVPAALLEVVEGVQRVHPLHAADALGELEHVVRREVLPVGDLVGLRVGVFGVDEEAGFALFLEELEVGAVQRLHGKHVLDVFIPFFFRNDIGGHTSFVGEAENTAVSLARIEMKDGTEGVKWFLGEEGGATRDGVAGRGTYVWGSGDGG